MQRRIFKQIFRSKPGGSLQKNSNYFSNFNFSNIFGLKKPNLTILSFILIKASQIIFNVFKLKQSSNQNNLNYPINHDVFGPRKNEPKPNIMSFRLKQNGKSSTRGSSFAQEDWPRRIGPNLPFSNVSAWSIWRQLRIKSTWLWQSLEISLKIENIFFWIT